MVSRSCANIGGFDRRSSATRLRRFSRMASIARRSRSTQGEIAPCARHVVGHRDRDRIDAPGICSGCRWQPH